MTIVRFDLLALLFLMVVKRLVQNARYIICRSGYTSIMDLVEMRKKALIIPTPGQPEQEYLARYLSQKGVFLSGSQHDLDLVASMARLEPFEAEFPFPRTDHLTKHIEDFSWMDDRQ